MLAEENGLIANEEDLSERFDSVLEECCPNYDYEDQIAINEDFSHYTDSLVKDGQLHPEQYSNYAYIGKYS